MQDASLLESPATFDDFLQQEQNKDLLRFTTAGSVDDGKSTLIGRLLYDSRAVYEDQLESVTKASTGRNAGTIDFSLLTDGLRVEREQGITIDVAYRYFATPKRKFIIADTPGHEQYTRNMVTGASTAELAIVLVDARKGMLPQSKRHAYISSLLGLQHVIIAVNKMDLVDYDQKVFDHIETDFRRFLSHFQSIEPYFVPISALAGDNVVTGSENTPWFHGPSLLHYLETVQVGNRAQQSPFRFPVQRVVRPNLDFRGYAGTIASGHVKPGDSIVILPYGREARIANIVTYDGDQQDAHAGQSVTLTLDREIDIARGDMIVSANNPPESGTAIEATLVWLNEQPAELNKRYRLKHTTSLQTADLKSIEYRININTLDREQTASLEMNAIAVVRLETARPISFDPYQKNRITGSFVLIDPATNATVAAGMISGRANVVTTQSKRTQPLPAAPLTEAERTSLRGHAGAIVHAGGRAELAWRLERALLQRGCSVFALPDDKAGFAELLLSLGALVVLTGTSEEGVRIQTVTGTTEGSAELLPESDLDALHAVEALLERLQILQPAGWSDSGGI